MEKIIIDVGLSNDKLINELDGLTYSIELLKQEQIDLTKASKLGTVGTAEYIKQTRENKQQIDDLTKSKKTLITSQESEINSLKGLKAQYKLLNEEYQNIDLSTKEGLKRSAALASQMSDLSDSINDASKQAGDFHANIGRYADGVKEGIMNTQLFGVSLGQMSAGFKVFQAGIANAASSLNVFKIALIGTGIGAFIVALGLLINYFQSTQSGADRLSQMTAKLGAALKPLTDLLAYLGAGLATALEYIIDLGIGITDFLTTSSYVKVALLPITITLGLLYNGFLLLGQGISYVTSYLTPLGESFSYLGNKIEGAYKYVLGFVNSITSLVGIKVTNDKDTKNLKQQADEAARITKQAQQLDLVNKKLLVQAEQQFALEEKTKNIRDDENVTLEERQKANDKLFNQIEKEYKFKFESQDNIVKKLEDEIKLIGDGIGKRELQVKLEEALLSKQTLIADKEGKLNEAITNRVSLQREMNLLQVENSKVTLEIMKTQGLIRTGDRQDQIRRTQIIDQEYAIERGRLIDREQQRLKEEERDKNKIKTELELKDLIKNQQILAIDTKLFIDSYVASGSVTEKEQLRVEELLEISKLGGIIDTQSIPMTLQVAFNIINDNANKIINKEKQLIAKKLDEKQLKYIKEEAESNVNASLEMQAINLKRTSDLAQLKADTTKYQNDVEIKDLENKISLLDIEIAKTNESDENWLINNKEKIKLQTQLNLLVGLYNENLKKGTLKADVLPSITTGQVLGGDIEGLGRKKFFEQQRIENENAKKAEFELEKLFLFKKSEYIIKNEIDLNNQIISISEKATEKTEAERKNIISGFDLLRNQLNYDNRLTDIKSKEFLKYQNENIKINTDEKNALLNFDKNIANEKLNYELVINQLKLSSLKNYHFEYLKATKDVLKTEEELRMKSAKSQEERYLILIEFNKKRGEAEANDALLKEQFIVNASQMSAEAISQLYANSVEDRILINKALTNALINSQADQLSVASQVAKGLSQIAGEQTAIGKALAITAITLDTIAQSTKIFTQAAAYSANPLTAPLAANAYIQGGLVIAKGAASIASISAINPANIAGANSFVTGISTIQSGTSSLGINSRKIKAINLKQKELNLATGGYVSGAGTSMSDSIPTNLSNGESVINAKSTSLYRPILSAINKVGGGVGFDDSFTNNNIKRVKSDYNNNQSIIKSMSMIQPVVAVKDINIGVNRVKVKERANRL